jgi:hypothetical protein
MTDKKKAATTEELASLHATVATTLAEDLTMTTPAIEADDDTETKKQKLVLMELAIKARHDARAHAITFLKNNNITAEQGNAELAELQKQLAKQREKRPTTITPAALDEAAEAFGQRYPQ